MERSPLSSAPAPLPVRRTRATLADIIGWPALTLLVGGYVALLTRLTSFPFLDFPDHLARAVVLADLLFHHGARWAGHFAFHWAAVPYLLHDLILTSLVATLGTTAGGVVFLELTMLSLPCALLYALHVNRLAHRAWPLFLLLSLYLTTDWFFLVGFAAYRLAIALLVLCIALAERLRQGWSQRLYGVYLLAVLAGYLDHLTAPAFLAATLAVSAGARLLSHRGRAREEMLLALPVALLLALYFGVLEGAPHATSPGIYSYQWGNLARKAQRLKAEFYDYGGRTVGPMMALLAFSLLWPVRRALLSRQVLEPPVLEQLALALTFIGVYLVLPEMYSGAGFVDIRALPMVPLFVLFAVLRLSAAGSPPGRLHPPANGFAGAPALAAAAVLAAVNLAYIGWHLEQDNGWMQRYRAVVAQVPRGATVLPIYSRPKATILQLMHASGFLLLDRGALIPYIFAGNLGDPMRYFTFEHRPYAPADNWYHLQSLWNRARVFTLRSQGEEYRWRFYYDRGQRDWRPAVLPVVSWGEVACEYPYILVSEPYDPSYIGVPTRTLAANASAALLAVDRSACRPRGAAAGATTPPPQQSY